MSGPTMTSTSTAYTALTLSGEIRHPNSSPVPRSSRSALSKLSPRKAVEKAMSSSSSNEGTPRLRATVKKLEETVSGLMEHTAQLAQTNSQLAQENNQLKAQVAYLDSRVNTQMAYLGNRVDELAAEDPYSGYDPSKRELPDNGMYG